MNTTVLSFAPDRFLVRFEPRPTASLRLFCFPWSGASASSFGGLATCLPDWIETIAVQLPGRGSRKDEPAQARLAPLAGQIVRALNAELTDRPGRFALFGHSFGALLAYEVARRLNTWRPELVVLSGSRTPPRPPSVVLHSLGDAELLAALARMGGTAPNRLRDTTFLDYFLPLVRADLTAHETYRPARGVLTCPVSVWGGNDDWYATPEEVSRWHQFAGSAFRRRTFAGGHFFTSDEAVVRAGILADLEWSRDAVMSDRAA